MPTTDLQRPQQCIQYRPMWLLLL